MQAPTSDQYQGLRRIAGNGKYPLQDSLFSAFIRGWRAAPQRGRGIQVTASSVYTPPADSLIFV